MKQVVYLAAALKSLRKHKADAPRIVAKIAVYSETPEAMANNVKKLVGSDEIRLRVGDYRILFTETENEIIVSRIGPRGSIYE
ncbi:type II toxin-antitoxin system RelE family toxin [Mesorhizobium sp. B1-1-8]|uniref:type II toxin-antitoxin system RelE family toxin n=1 Tax=Mesorhizobium sp. B1-1-8 TaxID=2589976 RepID=UPI00112C5808|nr:type II toxin-antitoxin system RelE/ParE family toxin [Mesorhizobium sp. B1-1-8]UCI06816.1 type II toxin-antitoxin system RelE/ParE family toxin [Mesorhizobium sp. B1-1-8]